MINIISVVSVSAHVSKYQESRLNVCAGWINPKVNVQFTMG